MTDNGSTHDPADAPPSNDGLKNQTSRISLESARPLKSPLEAKKATDLVSDTDMPAYAGPIPQTIRLKRPPTSPITVQPVDLPPPAKKAGDTALVQASTTVRTVAAETVKRKTSRIELAEAMAPKSPTDFKRTTGPILGIPMHAGPIPQTIRLKRPATSPVKRPPTSPVIAPAVMPRAEQATRGGQDITEAPTVAKHIAATKTPTSRIVLEELSAPVSATAKQPTTNIPPFTSAEPPAPKTIRLKRPSTLSDAEETIQVTAAEESLRTARKGETAKIDLPLEDSALTPITQRKTIKIKRTDRTVAPRSPIPAAAAAPEPGALVEAPVPEEEEAFVFPLVAFAATLCIAALVYIMVAQAFGVHLLLPASMQLH
ncbi:MAG: hypothetical protein NT011_13005 [Kiritimatiellaeota bacterium]|nr:hypothetical protein [Kiritimatiellota bacterium]